MTRTLLSFLLVAALGLVATAGTAEAQTKRAGDTGYLKLGVGFSDYTGDFDASPFSFNEFSEGDGFPFSYVGEVGYQTSPNFAVGLAYQFGRYPLVNDGRPGTDPDRLTGQLLGRYTFGAKDWTVAPYVDLGAGATFGSETVGIGPSIGAGLDIVLNNFASFYVESRVNTTFGDDAVDNQDAGGASYDAVNELLGIGVKLNFRSAAVAPRILALDGPNSTQTGDPVTFSATINSNRASRPLTYQWDFGDGSSGSGLTASHTYNQPGTYTVTFTASNAVGEASQTLTIEATRPPQPARISSINASPNPADEGEQVRFTSSVSGDSPISYEWDFGDGTTAEAASGTHTYDEPGTYTVRLRASNEVGEDTRTLTMTVERALPPICTSITEMNSAYFGVNSSTLTDEARSSLQENLDILEQCPNLDARIEGFAAPSERNAQSLSEDRARAVAQFYQDNGIDASRLTTSGEGQPSGQTSKKGGTRQFRRVDTIPQR